ncbi:hypothetical protein KC332_g80 [Hortaea werneckii]|nr:hypothetical protein KC348_g88 [Hortaea werneckii]KAI7421926.1 hypothetical protein KC332_g80 [Hortaea werneckii]
MKGDDAIYKIPTLSRRLSRRRTPLKHLHIPIALDQIQRFHLPNLFRTTIPIPLLCLPSKRRSPPRHPQNPTHILCSPRLQLPRTKHKIRPMPLLHRERGVLGLEGRGGNTLLPACAGGGE